VKALLAAGTLVPDDVTNQMVRERLSEPDAQHGAVLDGFPRNVAQAEFLDKLLAERGTELAGVLVLEVPEAELAKRLAGRAAKDNRQDDADPGVIRKRIATYRKESEPCIAYYRGRGASVRAVDGTGPVEAVRERLLDGVPAGA
jgi:adenylate kinase